MLNPVTPWTATIESDIGGSHYGKQKITISAANL